VASTAETATAAAAMLTSHHRREVIFIWFSPAPSPARPESWPAANRGHAVSLSLVGVRGGRGSYLASAYR
jgi:hypothetical protein